MTARACRSDALSICVFGGSATSVPQVFVDAAHQLGGHIATRGHRLVFGGTPIGLLGAVAYAAQDAGADILGVVPQGSFDHLIGDEPAGEVVATTTMAETLARADAFVVLPGGYGTLTGLVDMLTHRQLGLHQRPIVLVNVGGYWEPFLRLASQMVMLHFAEASEDLLFHVAESAARAIDLAETLAGPPPVSRVDTGVLAAAWPAAAPGALPLVPTVSAGADTPATQAWT